jgi:uncharacterized coiled-coil protein SlyX
MLDALLKWAGPWLLRKLAAILDPEDAAKAQGLIDRGKQLDAAHAQMNQAEADLQKRLAESEKRQADWQARIDEINQAITKDESDLASTKAGIDARPAVDLVEQPLPGTGSKSS